MPRLARAPEPASRAVRTLARALAPLAVAALPLLAPAAAEAQAMAPASDPAAADALFKAAQAALDRGDWDAACPKFDASMKLDAAVSTLLNIAKCHDHQGKLTLAWADCQRALLLNRDTLGAQRQRELEAYAKKVLGKLEPRIPRLRIALMVSPPGLALTRDGQDFPVSGVGEAIPEDPGTHEIVASAPGYRRERVTVVLAEGDTAEVLVRLTRDEPAGAARAAADPRGRRKVPVWAWAAGGAGLVLAGASVAFLVDERGAQADVDAHCTGPARTCPGYDAHAGNGRLYRDFDLFLLLGAVGLAGLGAGAYGIVKAPAGGLLPASPEGEKPGGTTARTAPWVTAHGAGVSVEGAF